MRVISGTARGKKLKSPPGNGVRPTMDRVKEALFNIINNKVRDSWFLDLFCGSGAIGIEALSRGCAMAVFVDKDRESIKVTNENLVECKFSSNRYKVLANHTLDALGTLHQHDNEYDIIFMDPPYALTNLEDLIKEISELDLLSQDGVLIAETQKEMIMPEQIGAFQKTDERVYSITRLTFYEYKGDI